MARDITTTFNSWAIDEEEFNKISNAIPGQIKNYQKLQKLQNQMQLGVAKEWRISRFINLLSEVNLNVRFEQSNDIFSSEIGSIDPALGIQLDYDKLVYLRLGVGNFQYITEFNNSKSLSVQPNFGVGFNYKAFN